MRAFQWEGAWQFKDQKQTNKQKPERPGKIRNNNHVMCRTNHGSGGPCWNFALKGSVKLIKCLNSKENKQEFKGGTKSACPAPQFYLELVKESHKSSLKSDLELQHENKMTIRVHRISIGKGEKTTSLKQTGEFAFVAADR